MKYRKKPVVIDAVQWDPQKPIADYTYWFRTQLESECELCAISTGELRIFTRDGVMTAKPGDWIIRGVKGELYPCRDDIFQQTYEPVENQ